MSEINVVQRVIVLDEKADTIGENLVENPKNHSNTNFKFVEEVDELHSEADEGQEDNENGKGQLSKTKETSLKTEKESDESELKSKDEREVDSGKIESSRLISGDNTAERETKSNGTEEEVGAEKRAKDSEHQNNKTLTLDRQGTDTGDVKITMAEKGHSSKTAIVITTVPPTPGPPKPKAKLERRKSLNPRVMTPPGLEILDNIQLLAIRQQMDMDIRGGCGAPNTYRVWDVNDEQIFFASEESGCLCRWACGPARQFSLDVFSASDDQVLNFHRTWCRCDCCCCFDCFMCLQKLYVVDCLGRTLGAVKQKFSIFNAKFDIVDHDNNVLFKVLGPCCPCRCATEIYFQILNKTGERQIGRVQKKWGGDRTDSVNVDHEYFDVTFPVQLDSVDKALILGAAFLVNCMYLEMS